MPVFAPADAVVHEVHGSTFRSLVAPSRGSSALCAWRLEVPAGLQGTAHRPNREEVLLVLDGELHITLDDADAVLLPGGVALVPAGSRVRVSGGPEGGAAWVTTTPGLEAVTDDGARLAPPWAR